MSLKSYINHCQLSNTQELFVASLFAPLRCWARNNGANMPLSEHTNLHLVFYSSLWALSRLFLSTCLI
jgi:hypothetical protein